MNIYPGHPTTWPTVFICAVIVQSLSRVGLFATPWTAALQAPLSIGFSRQEHCGGLPCPPLQGIFPTQGSNLHLLHWQVDSLLLSHQASPYLSISPQFFVTKLKYQLSEASIHKSRKAVFLTFPGIPQNFICPNDWMECRIYLRVFNWASLITQLVKNPPATQETLV